MKAIDWQSNDGYSTAAVQRLMNNIAKLRPKQKPKKAFWPCLALIPILTAGPPPPPPPADRKSLTKPI